MPNTFVVAAQNGGGWNGGTALTIATPAFNLPANCLVAIGVRWSFNTDATVSLADLAGNSFADCGHGRRGTAGEAGYIQMFRIKNSIAHATNVITATFSQAVPYRNIIVMVFSGANVTEPLDNGAVATITGGTTLTTGSFTPSEADCVAVMFGMRFGGTGLMTSDGNYTVPTNGESFDNDAGANDEVFQGMYRLNAPQSSQTATMGWTGNLQGEGLVRAFKAAPAPPAPDTFVKLEIRAAP